MKVPSNCMFTIFSEIYISPDLEKLDYVIFQKEACPTTGRIHLQGYAECKSQLTIKQFKKALNTEVNPSGVQRRRGTQKQAIEYCSKEESRIAGPFIFGTPKRFTERERTDLNSVAEAIENGASLSDIAEQNPKQYIMYNKGIRALKSMKTQHRNFKTEVHWVYGGTGKGKSRYAWTNYPDAYPKNTSEWWDLYDPDVYETVIMDDYRCNSKIRFDELLRLFDRYPHLVQQKGATVTFKPKLIILTTTHSPQDTFPHHEEDMDQLLRRIDKIVNLNEDPMSD